MAKRNISRKKLLKEPDKIARSMTSLLDFARARPKTLAILGTFIFLLIVGIAGFRYLSARSENRAFALLGQTESAYAQALAKGDAAQALETVSGDFKQLLDRYGDTIAGRLACLRDADAQFEAGRIDAAIALYDKALREFGDEPLYREQINDDLGHAYLRKKDFDKALGCFQKVVNGPNLGRTDEALFIMAWIYRKKGNLSEAHKMNAQLIAQYPESMYVDMAKANANG